MSCPELQPLGDRGLLVYFEQKIDPAIHRQVLTLQAWINDQSCLGLIETVPAYASLLLVFDPLQTAYETLAATVSTGLDKAEAIPEHPRLWTLPVCYGGRHGEDLESLARDKGVSADRLIEKHLAGIYRAYMVGFAPGYTYLGDLDPTLFQARRSQPRLETPAGSISIGGRQHLIAGIAMPSGWHLIGRTPFVTWDARRSPPLLIQPGDSVQFEALNHSDFDRLNNASAAGEWTPSCRPMESIHE